MIDVPDFLCKTKKLRGSSGLDDAMDAYRPLLASWLIELTLLFGWHKKPKSRLEVLLMDDVDFSNVTGINVEYHFDEEGDLSFIIAGKRIKYSDAISVRILKQRLEVLDTESVSDKLSLFSNIAFIGKILELSAAEKAILSFAAVMECFPTFRNAIQSRNEKVSTHRLIQIIAHLTGHSQLDIRAKLTDESPLIASGIVHIDNHIVDLEEKISLLDGFGSLLLQSHENEDALIEQFLQKASRSNLELGDFTHLSKDVEILKAYLSNGLHLREQGTNVLFYGAPGTGKTELVKALAVALGVDLYEISFSDGLGFPRNSNSRLRAYTLCQRILARQTNALLMFDEIEDVLPSHDSQMSLFGVADRYGDNGKGGKAWVNRTLERNSTPAIWVTNDANIDPAYLRRFDYSIHFPIPPQKVRMSIARHHLGQFNPTEDWLARIAANEQMTPAQYERAAKVARISCGEDHSQARALVEQTLDRSASLLGQKRTPARNTLHTAYDLIFINTNIIADKIITGLKAKPRGTFCFYGPAGTGKSELARHIADEIAMPLLVRRASDILSKWVGESEQNIARMFADARQQEAVLVLDEADSLLTDRREAMRSWEVTQVNELLTQMEAYEGIFICTTNLLEKLDQASLRRFAFKIKFDYLTADQRWAMFVKEFVRLGGKSELALAWEKSVRGLERLTPGDFSVAARQFEIMGVPITPDGFFRQLQDECQLKGSGYGNMGFLG